MMQNNNNNNTSNVNNNNPETANNNAVPTSVASATANGIFFNYFMLQYINVLTFLKILEPQALLQELQLIHKVSFVQEWICFLTEDAFYDDLLQVRVDMHTYTRTMT